jgi:hypothetical protein
MLFYNESEILIKYNEDTLSSCKYNDIELVDRMVSFTFPYADSIYMTDDNLLGFSVVTNPPSAITSGKINYPFSNTDSKLQMKSGNISSTSSGSQLRILLPEHFENVHITSIHVDRILHTGGHDINDISIISTTDRDDYAWANSSTNYYKNLSHWSSHYIYSSSSAKYGDFSVDSDSCFLIICATRNSSVKTDMKWGKVGITFDIKLSKLQAWASLYGITLPSNL